METAPPGLGASPPLRGAPRKSLDQRNIKMETYSWVGSTINMAMPQLAGAIDILVVQQPDGSLKSSPFYVRFGKYQVHLQQRTKHVRIVVNGNEASFGMNLSRSGKAYFLPPDDGSESGFGPKEADAAAAAGEEGALPQGGASSRSGYSSGDERASSLAPGTQDLSNDRTSNATGTGNATSGSWYSLESLYSLSSMSDLEVSESNDNGQERFVPGPKPRAQRPSKMSLVGLGFKPSVALKRPLRPLGGPAAPGGARQLQQHRKEASPAYTSKEQSAGSTAAADEHRTEHQQEQSRAGEAATGPEEAKAEASAAAPSLEDATPAAERVVGASSGGPHDQQDKEGLQSIRRLSSETFYLDALEFSDISDAQTFAGQGHGMKRSPECFQGNRGSAEKEGDEAPKGENCESENDGVLFGGIPLQIDSGYLGDSERRGRLESMEEVSTLVEEDGEMEASLCGRLVLEGMAPDQVALLFEENRVSIMDCIGPTGEVEDPDALMVRINGVIYPWSDMMASDIRAMKMSDTELDIFWDAASQQGDSSAPEEPSTEILMSTYKRSLDFANSLKQIWHWGSRTRLNSRDSTSSAKAEPEAAVTVAHGAHAVSFAERKLKRASVDSAGRKGEPHALVPTPEQLKSLGLKEGQNSIEFVLNQHLFGDYRVHCYAYLMNWDSALVVSDVDGTITKSDVLGHLMPAMGMDWSHSGVAKLLGNIQANGYNVMYLSSRAIAQASLTRDFLHKLNQDGKTLPQGPVVISPDGLLPSLYREVVVRRPHEFKIATLQAIRNLFPEDWNPFYAGFGNRGTDEVSYKAVGVQPGRIFTINPKGEIRRSSGVLIAGGLATLSGINELVNEVFPPRGGKASSLQEFSDATFWRPTFGIGLIDSDEEEEALKRTAQAWPPLKGVSRSTAA